MLDQNWFARDKGEHTRPGCGARRPAGHKRWLPRTQMAGRLRGSYHYYRNNQGPHLPRALPKPSGEDAGQSHARRACSPIRIARH
jgi:hypothetical protein